jgi:prepilin-type N-terminal cleavage/methylation domain-containing protein
MVLKVAATISRLKISKMNYGHEKKGLSLIEVLLVIALIGLIMTAAVPNMNKIFRASVQASVRRFSSLVRFAYDQSILTGRIHRIILDFNKQEWLIESADPLSLPVDELKSQYKREYAYKPAEGQFESLKNQDTQKLPRGVRLVEGTSWRLGGADKPIKKGVMSIYAFPNGYIDEASVVLMENSRNASQQFKVSTKSLTGRIQVEVLNETK